MSEILEQRDTARDTNALLFREKGTFNFISINEDALVEVGR